MKRFKKGQPVTVFGSWDGKGTIYFIQAFVESCGAKRMVIMLENGRCLGREFNPEGGLLGKYRPAVIERLTDAKAEQAALAYAATYIAEEKAGLEELIKRNASAGEGYRKSLQREIDGLHEPRAYNRTADELALNH